MINAFFDIDGCILSPELKFTLSPEKLVRKTRSLDGRVKFHLNSNRSLKGIRPIYDQIGFDGLIIFENGLGVYDPTLEKTVIEKGCPIDRERLSEILSEVGRVSFIDTDQIFLNPDSVLRQDPVEVYCEKTRVYTMTIYPRIVSNKGLQSTVSILNQVDSLVNGHYKTEYDISRSLDYFSVMLTPKTALKSGPMKEIATDSRIASFGDSAQDILMFKESAPGLIGCPSNAHQEALDYVRRNKGFISELQYTAGTLDFIGELKNAATS
ncbi:MAG: HAD hydrolase family protein [archaeon]